MKITSIKIQNFRNLEELKFSLTRRTFVSGKNGIGKTNTINALHYFLTNTLLTDSGSNANDISSILYDDTKGGKKPTCTITITLENGMELTKKLQEKWTKKRGEDIEEYGGIETLYYKNQAKITAKDFNAELASIFNIPSYESKKIDITRTLIDPLYLFQKVDYKDLRSFVINLCGDIKNENILVSNEFEPIRDLLNKYSQDETACRSGLKTQINTLNKDIKSKEDQIAILDTKGYDEVYHKSLLNKLSEINSKLNNIKGSYQEKIDYYTNKIKVLEDEESETKLKIKNKALNLSDSLTKEFYTAKDNYTKELLKAKEEALQGSTRDNVVTSLLDRKIEIADEINDISDRKRTIDGRIQDLVNIDTQKKKDNEILKARIQKAYEKIKQIEDTEIKEVKCFNCGTIINQDEIDNQVQIKTNNINLCKQKIIELESQLTSENEFEELDNQIHNQYLLEEKLEKEEEELNKELEEIDETVDKARNSNQVTTSPKIEELELAIKELEKNYEEEYKRIFSEEENELEEQTQKYEKVKNDYKQDIDNLTLLMNSDNEEEYNLKAELEEVETKYNEQASKAKNLETKSRLEEEKSKMTTELSNLEMQYSLVDLFIKTKIELLTQSIFKATGVNFIMLEDQINGGLKEVCYVLGDNNIPYEQLSTSEKIKIGCRMIKKLDTTLCNGICDLPVIIDKGECLDKTSINQLEVKQALISLVRSEDELKILNY